MNGNVVMTVATLLVVLLSTGTAGAQDAVEEAEAEWSRALIAADSAALDTIYADDLVYVHSAGSVDTKQEWLGAIVGGRIDFSAMTRRDLKVRNYGSTAVVNALYDVVINSRPMTIQYLTVYVKDEELRGRWRIVTQQTATLPGADR